MVWSNLLSPYTLVLAATFFLCVAAASSVHKARRLPAARFVFWMLLAILWQLLATVVIEVAPTPQIRTASAKALFGGSAATVPFFLLFALDYSGFRRISLPWLLVIWAIPVISTGLALTNEFHELIWRAAEADEMARVFPKGPAYHVFMAYVAAGLLASAAVLFRFSLSLHRLFRRQVFTMILALFFPLTAFVVYVTGMKPFPGVNTTLISYALTALVIVWARGRHGILDLVPVARDQVVDSMEEGVLVVDLDGRIVDVNPAFRALARVPDSIVGEPAAVILKDNSALLGFLLGGEPKSELKLEHAKDRYFDSRKESIRDSRGRELGFMVLLHDITETRLAHEEIKKQQKELEKQASTDGLTGVLNRRMAFSMLSRDLAKAQRTRRPLSVCFIDVDGLKRVNDTLGHHAGDDLIATTARILSESVRVSDAVCRIGGDEFLLIFPDTGRSEAKIVVARVLERASDVNRSSSAPFSIEFSYGIEEFDPSSGLSADSLVERADQKMYQQKQERKQAARSHSG